MRSDIFWSLLLILVPLSLLSMGGGPTVIAPLQRETVELRHWFDSREFLELFAISRAAPGPGSMLVVLIGWRVAGWLGAAVACLAFFLPSSLLYYGAAAIWRRHHNAPWRDWAERGLAPIAAGLMLAGSIAILRAAGDDAANWPIALAATAIYLRWDPHPIPILIAGGAIALAAGAL
jgi:chromate transporter